MRHWKTGTRLGLSLGVIFAVTLCGSLFTQNRLDSLIANIDHIPERLPALTSIQQLQVRLAQVVMPVNDYIITEDHEEEAAYVEIRKEIDGYIAELESSDFTPEEKELLAGIAAKLPGLDDRAARIFVLDDPMNDPSGGALMEEVDAYAYSIIDDADRLVASIETEVGARIAAADSTALGVLAVSRTVVVVIILVSIIVLLFVLRTTVRPLTSIASAAKTITDGVIAKAPVTERDDEVGQLSHAFNAMVDRISALLGAARSTVSDLSEATSEISSATEQQASGSSELAVSFSQTTATMEELAVTFRQIAEGASQVAEVAADALEAARAGETAVMETVTEMELIKEQSLESMMKVRETGERTASIGTILRIINDIADRTKVLALNAAIEAARAGDGPRRGEGPAAGGGDPQAR